MKIMRKKNWPLFLVISLAVLLSACAPKQKEGASSQAAAIYYCPMHTSFTSDKPGDCSICHMTLVKKENTGKVTQESVSQVREPIQEKTTDEVCAQHNCAMANCAMKLKANLKPGEKIVCPVCGVIVTLQNGKVIEIPLQSSVPENATEAKSANVKKEHKIIYYRNPMNPQVTSLVPAKDEMGMDYIPVYEDQTAAQPGVSISQAQQQLIGVKIEPVKKIELTKVIRASGKIAYDPELAVAQEEFVQALINAEAAKDSPLRDVIDRADSLKNASRNKLKLLGMSDEQISQLETNKKSDTSLYLPGKGESVWAYAWVYEYEIGFIKEGAHVDIEAVAYPGLTFKGVVVSINPVLDAKTRTNQIRIQVENPEGKLKPEMFINATITVALGEKLAVPDTAVLDTGVRTIVYVSKEDNVMESREVKLGQKAQGYYEVIAGLQEGESVVTSGNFLVDSESKLKSIN